MPGLSNRMSLRSGGATAALVGSGSTAGLRRSLGAPAVRSTFTSPARTRMITCMRTTLVLDDALLRQAKRRAAERNLTVSDVVNEALRDSFGRPLPAAPPFSMATYGRADRPVGHEPADFATELEDEDRARLR